MKKKSHFPSSFVVRRRSCSSSSSSSKKEVLVIVPLRSQKPPVHSKAEKEIKKTKAGNIIMRSLPGSQPWREREAESGLARS
jgi:hypothetical protein